MAEVTGLLAAVEAILFVAEEPGPVAEIAEVLEVSAAVVQEALAALPGRLAERDNPPRRLLGAILSRLKVLSPLDIAARRRPQDGASFQTPAVLLNVEAARTDAGKRTRRMVGCEGWHGPSWRVPL